MDFGLAFSYIFNDKEWFKKLALPALCSLIPIIGQFILIGWGLKAAKNVIDGNEQTALPKLDFGADLGRGFMAFVINFLYGLPVGIIAGLSAVLFVIGAEGDEALMALWFILGGCLGLMGLLFALLLGFMNLAGVANYVAKGEFRAAFNFKEVFGLLKKSFISWLLVLIAQILAMAIIAPLGAIACGIGALLTTAFAIAFHSHLLGQAYNKSTTPAVEVVEPV